MHLDSRLQLSTDFEKLTSELLHAGLSVFQAFVPPAPGIIPCTLLDCSTHDPQGEVVQPRHVSSPTASNWHESAEKV